MKNKLDYDDMKKIVKDICEEEQKEHNITAKIYPITILEYYKNGTFWNNVKLHKNLFYPAIIPIIAGGYNIVGTADTIIFLHHIKKIKKIEKKAFRLAIVCYHELRHIEQEKIDKLSYNGFLNTIGKILIWGDRKDYLNVHDQYSLEIGANMYGIKKAKLYLQRNYPDLYEKEKQYIEAEEQQQKFYYMTYDASEHLDVLIKTLKQKKNQKKLQKNKGKKDYALYEIDFLTIAGIFLNEDLTPKKIKEILNKQEYLKLDKRITYAFLSSKTFLENINFKELTEEELLLLKESLEYTNQLYQQQLKYLSEDPQINLIDFLKVEKNILKKIDITYYYAYKKVKQTLNIKRNPIKKLIHMKSIPKYLDKTNQHLKRTGYIKFDIFYIVGVVLTAVTMIYLLLKK